MNNIDPPTVERGIKNYKNQNNYLYIEILHKTNDTIQYKFRL